MIKKYLTISFVLFFVGIMFFGGGFLGNAVADWEEIDDGYTDSFDDTDDIEEADNIVVFEGEVYLDDPGLASGYLVSTPVSAPEDYLWDMLIIDKTVLADTELTVSILHPEAEPSDGAVGGFEELEGSYIESEEVYKVDLRWLSTTQFPSIKLKGTLISGNGVETPLLNSWSLTWELDTDGDGMPDDWENTYGLDPNDPTGYDGPEGDPDDDGLPNRREYLFASEPTLADTDTDNDGLSDNWENNVVGTDPNKQDTDDDGMWDFYEFSCGKGSYTLPRSISGLPTDILIMPNSKLGWQDPTTYNDRYAVLFSGGIDATKNKAKYWNQLIQIYDMLHYDYGYTDEHIYVLYADGNYPDSNNCNNGEGSDEIISHTNIIDYEATESKAEWFFGTYLKDDITIDSNDFLYMWFYDHGSDDNAPKASICAWDDGAGNIYLDDDELYSWCNQYTYARISFTIGTCYAGGFMDPSKMSSNAHKDPNDLDSYNNLNDLGSNVIISTCQDYRVTNSWYYPSTTASGGYYYKGFVYHHELALDPTNGKTSLMTGKATYTNGRYTSTSPDIIDCGGFAEGNFISLREAFSYSKSNDDYLNTNDSNFNERPQYWSSWLIFQQTTIGTFTYL